MRGFANSPAPFEIPMRPTGKLKYIARDFRPILPRGRLLHRRRRVFVRPDGRRRAQAAFTVLLDEGVLVNETRRAQEKMSRHFAQLSNVYGLWAYLHEGRFR